MNKIRMIKTYSAYYNDYVPLPPQIPPIKACVQCKHARIKKYEKGDKTPKLLCSLFIESNDDKNTIYKDAIEMRNKGADDPDACGPEGKLYQVRNTDENIEFFNKDWFDTWTKCLSNDGTKSS